MSETSTIFGGPLTVEMVDANFPLQEPDGIASRIKSLISNGEITEAELLYSNLRAADQGAVEHKADELLAQHAFSSDNLDLLRALRLGIQAGMQIGRQEGANVVNAITNGTQQ